LWRCSTGLWTAVDVAEAPHQPALPDLCHSRSTGGDTQADAEKHDATLNDIQHIQAGQEAVLSRLRHNSKQQHKAAVQAMVRQEQQQKQG